MFSPILRTKWQMTNDVELGGKKLEIIGRAVVKKTDEEVSHTLRSKPESQRVSEL